MPADAQGQASLAALLWQRLQPEGWPLPLQALPPGTAVVGGAVRDALLGRLNERPDLDLVVPAGAIALCQHLARRHGGSAVVLDSERDIGRLVLRGWCFDLAACEGHSLSDDLGRRDYSINAIALTLPPGAVVLDPCGGLSGLQQGALIAISEANLLSDPLRLLRGLRLACDLDFQLEAQTERWIRQHRQQLAQVAGERVLAELEKLASAANGAQGLLRTLRSGLLEAWLDAEPPLQEPLTQLNLARAEALELGDAERAWALPLARMACLAGPGALQRLRSSRALQQRVRLLRQQWQQLAGRPLQALAESERFALHRSLESDLPALLLLLNPDQDQEHRALLARWRQAGDPLCHPRPPRDGHQLQALLDLEAGAQLGQLLGHLSQERAFGRLPGDASDAQVSASARSWLAQQERNRRRV